MVQTPKYDNDTVNLGYLNKRLGETEESVAKNNNSIAQIPKNYSTPPNPPYYKDSLLCYGNKIYRCNITRLKGIFSWTDWSIVATDDTTVSDFINNTYEVEKLEIQEQIDGKVQTYYQETDPSIEWETDLEKAKHIGDYWYNTTDNTQWRYNQITTTTPITYTWGQVNVPKAVFDAIDTKKSIYTAKPSSYKKDDLWIIEETISDEELPIGTDENPITKGDWVFSIADSEFYNKEHWVKRDEDISLSYLEQHYYTIEDIDTSFEEIERSTDSKITKAKDEINLNVSQTYTTKTEHKATVNDFNEQIGTINQTVSEHKTTLSNLSVEVGEVSATVESVENRTEEISSNVNEIINEINPTSSVTGSSIIIEDASDAPLIELEIEGKSIQNGTPTPDTPVEIKSVGYENLFDEEFRQGSEGTSENLLNLFSKNDLVLSAGTYKFSCDLPLDTYKYAIGTSQTRFPGTATYIGGFITTSSYTFTLNEELHIGILINGNGSNITPDDIINYHFQITKDTKQHNFISDGKYGIEVKITGTNKFNALAIPNSSSIVVDSDGSKITMPLNTTNNGITTTEKKLSELAPDLKVGDTVYLNFETSYNTINQYIYLVGAEILWYAGQSKVITEKMLDSIVNLYANRYNEGETEQLIISNFRMVLGESDKPYQPYQKNTSLIILNQPLRGLPNGVKDIAYIRNNRLYVDRYVGSVVFDGSENWENWTGFSSDEFIGFLLNEYLIYNNSEGQDIRGFSNNFEITAGGSITKENIGFRQIGDNMRRIYLCIKKERLSTEDVTGLKNWLSTHNTQVDYELAEPYTEELGEIEMPSTFTGYNNITTTDELDPTINVEYVRNTVLSNYVEQHVAELKINEDQIKQSVETINSSVDGLSTDINRVEQITSDNSQILNIISTNIDKTTGDVREVTTTTGFTFNAKGMTIQDSEGYQASHSTKGTVYKDGDTITGQYTKDGSKQKDLELFGTYSYGKDGIDDTPMFVGELYTDENGEECFGHFYNGGDY